MQFIELFAGAGGMGIGFHAAGMGHELSIEKEEAPHSVLVNAGKIAVRMDLRDVGGFCNKLRFRPDIIAGGPPCQDFSKAGQRKITDRAFLTQHFAQIICVTRPEWFIFENVPEAAKSSQYQYARALWKRHGYGLTELVMDAQNYGVPQRRKRFFCIGRLDEIDQFLLKELEAAKSPRPMVVREMLDPKLYPEDAELLKKGAFFARPWMGKKNEPNGRGIISIDEVCPTIARNTREHPGDTYIAHPNDAADLEEAHILTIDQVARIQGFPPTYDFQKKKKKYARGKGSGWPEKKINLMIANAVPAPMARAIGQCIYDRHHGYTTPILGKGFTDFILETKKWTADSPKNAIYNIRSMVNRARKMVGCRIYSNLALELQALEASTEVIWTDKKTRRSKLGKAYKAMGTRLRSDLRSALELHHAYVVKFREPSEWEPIRKSSKKTVKKKSKKATAKPATIPEDEHAHLRKKVVTWPLSRAVVDQDPEISHLEALLDDAVPEFDPFDLHPPRSDPSELWRPEGYDSDYEDYLESLEDDD